MKKEMAPPVWFKSLAPGLYTLADLMRSTGLNAGEIKRWLDSCKCPHKPFRTESNNVVSRYSITSLQQSNKPEKLVLPITAKKKIKDAARTLES